MSPPRIRHCRLPHPQSTPEQTREKTPLIRSRAKLRLSMLIKPSFHQRSRNTTRLCAPCSAPSATKPARRSVPRADVATGWAEGNRSLTPVRAPSHRSVHHPPPWRRVAHLPSDFTQEPLFFFFPKLHTQSSAITSRFSQANEKGGPQSLGGILSLPLSLPLSLSRARSLSLHIYLPCVRMPQ